MDMTAQREHIEHVHFVVSVYCCWSNEDYKCKLGGHGI